MSKKIKAPVDSDSYGTPLEVYNWLNKHYKFHLDACASAKNYKHKRYFSKKDNALTKNWNIKRKVKTHVFMNPPYSRANIGNFIKKAYEESLKGAVVVCLVRDDPTTGWYKEFVDGEAATVYRLKERIKFDGGEASYNFPCCVVIYDLDNFEGTEYLLKSYKEKF